MGLFDGLLKQALGGKADTAGLGGVLSLVATNPGVLKALGSLLSTQDTSVGGDGGLGGLVSLFQKKGLGDTIASWISTGPNPPISASSLGDVLGQATLSQFAAKAGVPPEQASSILAGLLPVAIDRLTPEGRMPDTTSLESTLSSLLAKLG